MIRFTRSLRVISLFLSLVSFQAFAAPDVKCLDKNGKSLTVDNARVLNLKHSTANQFLARARLNGVILEVYPSRNGHSHFQAKIGAKNTDTIEVVYNDHFGDLPRLVPGQKIEACGDYITSKAATSQYEPSPDGAIIHWLHRAPNPKAHASGYLMINGALYGHES